MTGDRESRRGQGEGETGDGATTRPTSVLRIAEGHQPRNSNWPPCKLCGQNHDETITRLIKAEYRRITDDELASERAYVERELIETNDHELEAALRHRLAVLQDEERRRRRLAAQGGPLYKRWASIPQDRIARAKNGLDIANLIACDLNIAWIRGDRTWFYCPAHGAHDGRRWNRCSPSSEPSQPSQMSRISALAWYYGDFEWIPGNRHYSTGDSSLSAVRHLPCRLSSRLFGVASAKPRPNVRPSLNPETRRGRRSA